MTKMKISSFRTKHILFSIAASSLLSIFPASAQDEKGVTSDQLELYNASNLWINTLNSAGINLFETLEYTDVYVGYKQSNGDFKRQQEGDKNNGFLFSAEGTSTIKDFYIWGKFSLETEKKRGSRFNASIIDPFRGMPFIIADNKDADWRLQYYNLAARISTPKLADNLYAGIGVNYSVSTGAKQIDPRPENRYYSLELTPSIAWTFNKNNSIGGTFYYKNMHEISDINNKNNYVNSTFYKLEGLGAFTETSGILAYRDYRGNSFGGELEYGFKSDKFDFLFSGGYIYEYENVGDGTNLFINSSRALRDNYFGDLSFVIKGNKDKQKITASGTYQNINGIFYDNTKDPNDPTVGQITLYKKTRSKFKTTQLNLVYDYFKLNESAGYIWTSGAGVSYIHNDDIYLLPQPGVASSTQELHRYNFDIHGKYNIDKGLPFRGQLIVGADVLYSLAGDCSLNYGGDKTDHIIYTDLLQKDFQFLSENYWKMSLDVQYSVPLMISGKSVNAYCKLNGGFIPDVRGNKRTNFMISLGFVL